MVSPERTLAHIRARLGRSRPKAAAPAYQAPAIADLVQRIERALEARC